MKGLARFVGYALLWLATTAIVAGLILVALYQFLLVQAPNDPSVGDAFVWGVILGFPVILLIAGAIGGILTVLARRAFARRARR